VLRSGDKGGQKRDLAASASGLSGIEAKGSKKRARATDSSADHAPEKSKKNPVSSQSSQRFSKNSLLGKDSDDGFQEPESSRKGTGKRGGKTATEGKKEKPVLYAMTDKHVSCSDVEIYFELFMLV
jgi:hypothetical protein